MKMNDKFFSFPPFLSTSWEHITALSLDASGQIVVHLSNGEAPVLPPLSLEDTQAIFKAHASFLEKQVLKEPLQKKERPNPQQWNELPIRIGFGAALDGMPAALQHNPAQSQAPDLPPEMLGKIAQISKILVPEELQELPPAEPHCNCPHCQIVRAILGETRAVFPPTPPPTEEEEEEEVSDSDLQFQQWEIVQTGDKLFTVTNKLDTQEKYRVYLGHPVGCTCGKPSCEHILVVLKS
jgi:hypothetical protein